MTRNLPTPRDSTGQPAAAADTAATRHRTDSPIRARGLIPGDRDLPSPALHGPPVPTQLAESGSGATSPGRPEPAGVDLSLRVVLGVLAARWTVPALRGLESGHVRFNRLRRHLGVSHKVLVETLRALQRDGYVVGPLTGPTSGSRTRPPAAESPDPATPDPATPDPATPGHGPPAGSASDDVRPEGGDPDRHSSGYQLTDTGQELLDLVRHIGRWAVSIAPAVRQARTEFDGRVAPTAGFTRGSHNFTEVVG